jgi:hypothetical protein
MGGTFASQGRKTKASAGFPAEAFDFSRGFFVFLRQRISLPGTVPRNSANSAELLIFVMNQGSGPRVAVGCSWITLPIGVGPKAIE